MTTYCRATLNYIDGLTPVPVEVPIADGRAADAAASWEEEGFELVAFPSEVQQWSDAAEVERVYEPEVTAFVKERCGCDAVLFFPGLVRDPAREAKHADLGPVRLVHSDYTEGYRAMIEDPDHPYRAILKPSMERAGVGQAEIEGARRVLTLQLWRSIGPREVDHPLAFCDGRTVARSELHPVPVPEYGGLPTGFESFLVAPPERPDAHAWTTFPAMARDEAVLFRSYDSEAADGGLPFWTPHSAFADPMAGPDAGPRESIEIRAICLFA